MLSLQCQLCCRLLMLPFDEWLWHKGYCAAAWWCSPLMMRCGTMVNVLPSGDVPLFDDWLPHYAYCAAARCFMLQRLLCYTLSPYAAYHQSLVCYCHTRLILQQARDSPVINAFAFAAIAPSTSRRMSPPLASLMSASPSSSSSSPSSLSSSSCWWMPPESIT